MKFSTQLLITLLLIPILAPWTRSAPASIQEPRNHYTIIVTGGEILAGAYADAHTHFLTRTLSPLGLQCTASLAVDDNPDAIRNALQFAVATSRIVIVTGGLGPTPNDITRETLSEFTQIPLREHPDALAALEKRFGLPRDQLRTNLRRQTLVPIRGHHLNNSSGTAVGLVFDTPETCIIALPGPPRELQPMVRDELLPLLHKKFGVRSPGSSMTLRFVGVGQSSIDQTIHDHLTLPPDLVITSLFQGSRVDFTFSLPTDTDSDRDRLNQLRKVLSDQLEASLYAQDSSSLEQVTLAKLRTRGTSLSVVEIGNRGRLTAALANTPGAEDFLIGSFSTTTISQAARLLGSPSKPTPSPNPAKSLALSAARLTGSDLALVVGPVEPGPDGLGAMQIGLASHNNQWVASRIPLRTTPEVTDPDAVTQILDWLRRQPQ
jgi:nicotinamide-nucleotide amidase